MNGWIGRFKDSITVAQVALAGGLDKRLRTVGPCPACSAKHRGSEDKRGPVGISGKGDAWECFACGAKGDAVEMAALCVTGSPGSELDRAGWESVRTWAVGQGLLTEEDGDKGGGRRGGSRRKPTVSTGDLVSSYLGGAKPSGKGSGGPRGSNTRTEEPEAPVSDPPARGGLYSWDPGAVERGVQAMWAHEDVVTPEAKAVRDYLIGVRLIAEEALTDYRIGVYTRLDGSPVVVDGRPVILIPLHDEHGRVVNLRFRSVPVPGTCPHCNSEHGCGKCRSYRVCSGRPLPLYGAHMLSADTSDPVVLVEGELDVLALFSYGYPRNVVSTTAGAGTFRDSWLDLLEPYSMIVGCYDTDDRGAEGWAEVSSKLGGYRCATATLPEKDANACLMAGVPQDRIDRAIQASKPVHGVTMRKVHEYADPLETLIENPGLLRGVATGTQKLDDLLGGIRPGLITISAETGQGKTTFGTWLILELARMGLGALITSFEQEPIGTVQKLLRNEIGGDFTAVTKETRISGLKSLGSLPLWIMDHYGQITPAKLIETIRYAKRRDGVRYFLIDHLGFLVDAEAESERRAIEAVVRALALLAHQEQITVFLIVHPHNIPKGRDGTHRRVTYRDLKGASAIRQDSDDILIVEAIKPTAQKPWPSSIIHADKVRSDFGVSGGNACLAFDPGSCVYADTWDDTPAGREGLLVPRAR